MIDTIGLLYPITLPPDILQNWGHSKIPLKNGFKSTYFTHVETENGAVVTYFYIPHIPKLHPILKVEVSLPHLIFGDNVYIIDDLVSAVDQANQLLPKVDGVPQIDLWKGSYIV